MLTDFEDSLLAMSDGEPASLAVAVQVLSSWHGRPVSREVVEQSACRLANLWLRKWGPIPRGGAFGGTKKGTKFLPGKKIATFYPPKSAQKPPRGGGPNFKKQGLATLQA